MLFLNRGFMEQIIMWIGNYDLGPDPQDFPRLARPSPRRDWEMVFFFFLRYLKIPQELTEIEAFRHFVVQGFWVSYLKRGEVLSKHVVHHFQVSMIPLWVFATFHRRRGNMVSGSWLCRTWKIACWFGVQIRVIFFNPPSNTHLKISKFYPAMSFF